MLERVQSLSSKVLRFTCAISLLFMLSQSDTKRSSPSTDHQPKITQISDDQSNGWQRLTVANLLFADGLPVSADITHQHQQVGFVVRDDTSIINDQLIEQRFKGHSRAELVDLKFEFHSHDDYSIHIISLKQNVRENVDTQSLGYWSGLSDPYFIESFKAALQTDLLFPGKEIRIVVLFAPETVAIANPSALTVTQNTVDFIVNFQPAALRASAIIGNMDIVTHEAMHTYFLPSDKIPHTLNESLAKLAGRVVNAQLAKLAGMDVSTLSHSKALFMTIAGVRQENGQYQQNLEEPCNAAIITGTPQDYCDAASYHMNRNSFKSWVEHGVFPFAPTLYKGRRIAEHARWDLEGKIFRDGKNDRFFSQYELASLYLYLASLPADQLQHLQSLPTDLAFNEMIAISNRIKNSVDELFLFNVQHQEMNFIRQVYEIAANIPTGATLRDDQVTTYIRRLYPDGSMDLLTWYVKTALAENQLHKQTVQSFPEYSNPLPLKEHHGVYAIKVVRPLTNTLDSTVGNLDIHYTLPAVSTLISQLRVAAKNSVVNAGYPAERLNKLLALIDSASPPHMSYSWLDAYGIWQTVPQDQPLDLNLVFSHSSLITTTIIFEQHLGELLYPPQNTWYDFMTPWQVGYLDPFDVQIEIIDPSGKIVAPDDQVVTEALSAQSQALAASAQQIQTSLDVAIQTAEDVAGTQLQDYITIQVVLDKVFSELKSTQLFLPLIHR